MVRVRRYLCQSCASVIEVIPLGVLRHKLYSACAIAMAFALWGVERKSARQVRAEVSPWRIVGVSEEGRWRSLVRWAGEAAEGGLFRSLGLESAAGFACLRDVAARVAGVAVGLGPPADRGDPVSHRAWHGGLRMA